MADPITSTIALAKGTKDIVEALPDEAKQPFAAEFGKAAAPAGRHLGEAVVTLAQTVNTALSPLKLLIWGWKEIEDWLYPELEGKFRDKPERLQTPNPVVAGPAILSLQFAASDPTLREMYLNLLAAAMDKEAAMNAHPAFVEIIKQLSPDDAKVLRFVSQRQSWKHEAYDNKAPRNLIRQEEYKKRKTKEIYTNLARAEIGCQHSDLIQSYLGNLKRMELIEYGATFVEGFPYEAHIIRLEFSFSIGMTEFGRLFCRACM